MSEELSKLHNVSHAKSGIFADTWSSSLMKSLGVNKLLSAGLSNVTINVEFPETYLGYTLETVSKLIATKDLRGADLDTFYIEMGGYDTHSDVEEALNNLFAHLNGAITSFSEEMNTRDLWDNVTIIQTSDFARTLNPNGGDGTDHAWGGNYMMIGGSVKGGQIVGEYPEDITDEGPWTLGRGRMIPTTPWEVPFTAIARWLGIQGSSDIEKVCPNIVNFDSVSLADPESMMSNSITTPTQAPTATLNPSWISSNPSKVYSSQPSNIFSTMPSLPPSGLVSSEPSTVHSILPSLIGSPGPSIRVSSIPSMIPSFKPSVAASLKPSIMRSDSPSVSMKPTELPSSAPSKVHSSQPSNIFSTMPSLPPSGLVSSEPSTV